jgi:hypothetical protein
MSYARFGCEGSDVYIYLSVDGWIECCACSLQPTKATDSKGIEFILSESFKAYNTQEMIYHIGQHREAGHFIPYYVEEDLKLDHEENMKYIKECKDANL